MFVGYSLTHQTTYHVQISKLSLQSMGLEYQWTKELPNQTLSFQLWEFRTGRSNQSHLVGDIQSQAKAYK